MMVEIFLYTERVVNKARPRKVLMMAIGRSYLSRKACSEISGGCDVADLVDGVAPRAKMNQQRSRRFRAAQEAKDKEIERQEAIKLFGAMGHPVSEATRNQKGWDSNAITPGEWCGRLPIVRSLQPGSVTGEGGHADHQEHHSWTF